MPAFFHTLLLLSLSYISLSKPLSPFSLHYKSSSTSKSGSSTRSAPHGAIGSPAIARRQVPGEIPCGLTDLTSLVNPFSLRVQNISYPEIHNQAILLLPAGGTDRHMFLEAPPGITNNLTLDEGVLNYWQNDRFIRGVINGGISERDGTGKFFFTQRSDPRAVFDVYKACPDDEGEDGLFDLKLKLKPDGDKAGDVCVRRASGRWEIRWNPKGNTKGASCITVTLAIDIADGGPEPSPSPSPSASPTPSGNSTISISSSTPAPTTSGNFTTIPPSSSPSSSANVTLTSSPPYPTSNTTITSSPSASPSSNTTLTSSPSVSPSASPSSNTTLTSSPSASPSPSSNTTLTSSPPYSTFNSSSTSSYNTGTAPTVTIVTSTLPAHLDPFTTTFIIGNKTLTATFLPASLEASGSTLEPSVTANPSATLDPSVTENPSVTPNPSPSSSVGYSWPPSYGN